MAIFHPNTIGFVESSANSFQNKIRQNSIQVVDNIFVDKCNDWCINVSQKE